MGIFETQAADRSDWTDQDLLTLDEAEERLIALEKEIRAELDGASGEVAEALNRRLGAVGWSRHKIHEHAASRQHLPPS